MARQAFGIVGGVLADDIHVRIVAGDATDAWICAVEALAVGETVGLETNGQLAAPVIAYHRFPGAMTLAAKIAAQPPLSVAMTKLTVNRLAHALDDLASHMDVDQFALASLTEDHKEGVAAFLDRRKPRFKGR